MAVKLMFSSLSILLVLSCCSLIHARESKFFSKATVTVHNAEESTPTIVENPAASPEYAPAPAPAPVVTPLAAPTPAPTLAPVPQQTENGYGLYGSESDPNVVKPEKEVTNSYGSEATFVDNNNSNNKNNFENQMLSEEFNAESLEKEQQNYPTYNNYNNDDDDDNSDRYPAKSYNLYGYTSELTNSKNDNNNGFSDTYKSTTPANKGYYYSDNYNGNGAYVSNIDQQGMSDTRYMEKGKYYYDIKSDLNGYGSNVYNGEAEKGSYRSSNQNEFNTMEEYYQSQGYQSNPEEYVP